MGFGSAQDGDHHRAEAEHPNQNQSENQIFVHAASTMRPKFHTKSQHKNDAPVFHRPVIDASMKDALSVRKCTDIAVVVLPIADGLWGDG
jgi:hypothetical protein